MTRMSWRSSSHEMAHLVLNHPKLVADNNAKVFEAW